MSIIIKKVTVENIEKYNVSQFLFDMIKHEYKTDYIPEYHYDIINIKEYYLKPERNNFLLAIDEKKDKLVGTSGIRSYDKNYHITGKTYNGQYTASLFRVFIHPDYRRQKIASKLIDKLELFCMQQGYNEIYLHTQKTVQGALDFWIHNNYNITKDTNNKLGTVHMEKIIASK